MTLQQRMILNHLCHQRKTELCSAWCSVHSYCVHILKKFLRHPSLGAFPVLWFSKTEVVVLRWRLQTSVQSAVTAPLQPETKTHQKPSVAFLCLSVDLGLPFPLYAPDSPRVLLPRQDNKLYLKIGMSLAGLLVQKVLSWKKGRLEGSSDSNPTQLTDTQ